MNSINLKVVVCGTSAWLTGLADGLGKVEGLSVQCLSPRLLKTVACLAVLAPDVVIVERNTWDWMLLRLPSDFPVIELDAAQSISLVRNTHKVAVRNLEDLVHVIKEVTHTQALATE